MFVDESGTEQHTVLAGVIVTGPDWKAMETRVRQLKLRYFPDLDPYEVELRSHDILQRKKAFKRLDDEQRRELMTDLTRLIQQLQFCLIGALIHNEPAQQQYGHLGDIYELAYTFLLERFQMHIQGPGRYGMVICDSRSKSQDYGLALHHLSLLTGKSRISPINFRSVVGTLVVQDSRLEPGLQIADLCAYTILRHRGSGKPYAPWKVIEPKFRRDENGNYMGIGLKEFP